MTRWDEALKRGTQGVLKGLEKEASKGKLTPEQAREAGERLSQSRNWSN